MDEHQKAIKEVVESQFRKLKARRAAIARLLKALDSVLGMLDKASLDPIGARDVLIKVLPDHRLVASYGMNYPEWHKVTLRHIQQGQYYGAWETIRAGIKELARRAAELDVTASKLYPRKYRPRWWE